MSTPPRGATAAVASTSMSRTSSARALGASTIEITSAAPKLRLKVRAVRADIFGARVRLCVRRVADAGVYLVAGGSGASRTMVTITAEGGIEFSLRQPDAQTVELVGAFEGWHERRLAMRRADDGLWHLTIDPGPGVHLFRYLVDGRDWVVDRGAHGVCMSAEGVRKARVYRPPLRRDDASRAA